MADVIRPGDLVVVAQGAGEPTTLLEHLVAESYRLDDVEIFVGLSHSDALKAPEAEKLSLVSFGAMGPLGQFSRAGNLAILPCTFNDVARTLARRAPGRLVLAVHLGPETAGTHTLGVSVDYTFELLKEARAVVAEINDLVPTTTAPAVPATAITAAVTTSRNLVAPRPVAVGDVHRAIAQNVASLVSDDSTIQLGVGSVPSVVAEQLTDRAGLRVRSTLVGDWLLTLARAGALNDERGAVVISEAAGTSHLHEYVKRHDVVITTPSEVSQPEVLASIPHFVAMNAALQVDLTGQVNAEVLFDHYVGGIGGQPDFLRAAQHAPDGRSIVMLPSTSSDRRSSRIVGRLHQGTVTTPRSGVDFVVTEYGVADLRGRSLTERSAALVEIAAPGHRRQLRKELN